MKGESAMERLDRARRFALRITVVATLLMVRSTFRAADQTSPANQGKKGGDFPAANAGEASKERRAADDTSNASEEVTMLKRQLELQERRMERLEAALAEQKELPSRTIHAFQAGQPFQAG